MASGKKIKTWLTKPVVVHCGYGVIIACLMTYFITKCSNDSKLNQEKTMEINNLQKTEEKLRDSIEGLNARTFEDSITSLTAQKLRDSVDCLNARTFEDSITSLTAQLQECEKENDSLNEMFKKNFKAGTTKTKGKETATEDPNGVIITEAFKQGQKTNPAPADTIPLEEEKIDIQIANNSENKGDIQVENVSGYTISINIDGSTNSGDITIGDFAKDPDKAKSKTDNNVVHCIYEKKSIEKYVVYRSKGNSY